MKKRFFLLSMLAILIFSFKPYNETNPLKTSKNEQLILNSSHEILTFTEHVDDQKCILQIQITWVGNAAYGTHGAEAVRANRRTHYERFHGKSPLESVIDNNNEFWSFTYDCSNPIENDLRATIEADPDICEDTDYCDES